MLRKSILVALMLSVIFSVCGGGPVAASEEPISLNYWSMWNEAEPQADVLKDTVNRFTADNPHITVNVSWGGRAIRQVIQSALAAGQDIDIIEYDPAYIVRTIEEHLLPLDDYVNRPYDVLNGGTVFERCAPVLWEYIKAGASDGAIYSTPSSTALIGIFYNKEHFREAGITSAPNTWAEFVEVCEKLKAAGFIPFSNDDAYMTWWIDHYLQSAKGDAWIGEAAHDKTGEYWKDPAVLEMARAFDDLRAKGLLDPRIAGNISPAGQLGVALGEISMFLNGSWFPNEVKDLTGPDFEWGAFQWPSAITSVQPNTVMRLGSQGFSINKDSRNPDAAFELLAYFNADETERDLAVRTITLPVVTSVAPPALLSDCEALIANSTGIFINLFENSADLAPILLSNFTRLVGGTLTPEQFVEEMVRGAQ